MILLSTTAGTVTLSANATAGGTQFMTFVVNAANPNLAFNLIIAGLCANTDTFVVQIRDITNACGTNFQASAVKSIATDSKFMMYMGGILATNGGTLGIMLSNSATTNTNSITGTLNMFDTTIPASGTVTAANMPTFPANFSAGSITTAGAFLTIPSTSGTVTAVGTTDILNTAPDSAGVTTLLTRLPGILSITPGTGGAGSLTLNGSTIQVGTPAVLAASQPNYAPAKEGDAMALTSDERTTLAGVIWNTLTSALTAVGSIGKWLANLANYAGGLADTNAAATLASATAAANATSSILNAQTLLATGWTVVDGKVVWTAAALANIPTAEVSGSGADKCIQIIRSNGATVPDAQVWVTSDPLGSNSIAGPLSTDDNGMVTFLLNAGTVYYLWMKKDGVNPILGQQFTARAG